MKCILFVVAALASLYFVACIICGAICGFSFKQNMQRIVYYKLYNAEDCNDLINFVKINNEYKVIGIDCGLSVIDRQAVEQVVTVVSSQD